MGKQDIFAVRGAACRLVRITFRPGRDCQWAVVLVVGASGGWLSLIFGLITRTLPVPR